MLEELDVRPNTASITVAEKELFAEISFADFDSLCNAAAIIDKSHLEGKPFQRTNSSRKSQFTEDTSVFVRNLPPDVGNHELFTAFQ